MRSLFLIAMIASFWSTHALGFDQSHADWSSVLRSYLTSDGTVRYSELKLESTNRKDHPFSRYIEAVQGVARAEFDKWTTNDQEAFLINAYNALTVKLIVDNYPVKSIRNIGGIFKKPWGVEFFTLLGGAATRC